MENKQNLMSFDELVFEHRNKAYGAYELRKKYVRRLLLATSISLILFSIGVASPKIYAVLNNILEKDEVVIPVDKNIIVQMEDIKANKEEQVIVEEPPQQLEKAIKFTAPEVSKDVKEDEEIASQEELKESQAGKETVENGLEFGSLVDTNAAKTVGIAVDEKPFLVVEEPPQPHGGIQTLYKFIGDNIRYPEKAMEMEVEGKVYVQFVVAADGKVKDAKVVRSLDPECDREALRVIKMLPPWTPGRQSGKEVAVYYTLPIQFKLVKK